VKQILILVEGQTEEEFVKQVLNPYLNHYNRHLTPTIINTKIVKGGKNFKGGLDNYGQVKRDLLKLVRSNTLTVTTFIDFYALPNDFPGYDEINAGRSALEKVLALEQKLHEDIGAGHFIPYIQLHEFEALLFSSMNGFYYCYGNDTARINALELIISQFPNPEDINNNLLTAPSKRILNIIPNYQKPFQGGMIALENGIQTILEKCPHFRA
jgi:Domain of unknown function (DUF4276)